MPLPRSFVAAAVFAAEISLSPCSAVAGADATPSVTNQTTLDYAVEPESSAWCTGAVTPARHLVSLPMTIEGWFRLDEQPADPSGLFELSDGAGRSLLRLLIDSSRHLVALLGQTSLQSAPEGIQAGLWTHYSLRVREDGMRLTTWDFGRGERSAETQQRLAMALPARVQVCLGGEKNRAGAFRGLLDEVRLWSAALSDGDLRAWRHRTVSGSHPAWKSLLAYWPFRTGKGSVEPDLARLGPLTTTTPVWVPLPRLDYGPILRAVDARSARVLFHARRADGSEQDWTAALEVSSERDSAAISGPAVTARDDTDFVGHLEVTGLSPETRYSYVPMIDGRRAFDGDPATFPSFRTAPGLGGRNVDFTAVFFADQHTYDLPEMTPMPAYAAAAAAKPLFWAQLGDVDPGNLDGKTQEYKRSREILQAVWERNYGTWDSPQSRFVRSFPLNIAAINDHEIADNFSLNWHLLDYAGAASAEASTLHDRNDQYDLSIARWWNYFGWGMDLGDRLGRVASTDHGESVMGERYRSHGFYHAYQPYPFVEFFVLDTTSYRGDTYERRKLFAKTANRDTDHSRYPWNPETGPLYIFGDQQHGANSTTDHVRSWLGPTQKQAFLQALASSTAKVVVIAAGYPLYSSKFERSDRYWEARESGFDYATEVEEIVSALEGLDKLVIWVHGDGHSPENVRLRRNVYQLQIGPTFLANGNPGHRSRKLVSGVRSKGDSLGGGFLISGHQPDLDVADERDDFFAERLDQFRGYLRLYFHPGQEVLRSSQSVGVARSSERSIEIPVKEDPARGDAARLIVGKVARLELGETIVHSVVSSYRYEDGRVVLTFEDPIVRAAPDELRILVDAVPWVEARWIDSEGHEWRDFSFVFRKDL